MSECSAAALAGHSEPQGAGKYYVPTAGTRIPPAKLEISKRCPGMGLCRNEARVRTKDVEELDVVKERRQRQALAKASEHKVDPQFEKAHELYIQGENADMLTISIEKVGYAQKKRYICTLCNNSFDGAGRPSAWPSQIH